MSFWGNVGHDFLKVLGATTKVLDITDTALQSPIGLLVEAAIPGSAQFAAIEHLARINADAAEAIFSNIPKAGPQKLAWVIGQSQALVDLVMNIESALTGKPPNKITLDPAALTNIINAYVQAQNSKSAVATMPVATFTAAAA